MGARRWALTEPERGVLLLNPRDCTAGYALLNPIEQFLRSLLLLTEANQCCLWMNNERCCGGLDVQFPVGVDEQDPVVLPLDEQDPDRSSQLGLYEQ